MTFEFDQEKSLSNKEKHGIDMKKKSISAEEFDASFDHGEDVVKYLAVEMAERPGLKQWRVSVDFPTWMVQELDREAKRLGITRQSVIKYWISEKLHPTTG